MQFWLRRPLSRRLTRSSRAPTLVAGEVDSVPEGADAVPEDGEAVAERADAFAEIGDLAPLETATSRAADPPDGDRGEDASAHGGRSADIRLEQ